MFSIPGFLPGCPGVYLPLKRDKVLCFSKEPYSYTSPPNELKKIQLSYSTAGGADHERSLRLVQKSVSAAIPQIDFQTQPRDQQKFLSGLKTLSAPTLFRRGLALNRPTCFAAIEALLDDPVLFSGYKKELEIEKTYQSMSLCKTAECMAQACLVFFQRIQDSAALIPLGELEFSYLISPKFEGISLNSLNQLDFTNLRLKKP